MSWLLANSLLAAALAVLVLLIGRTVRPAPAVMHGLWLCVLLKLVTPPLFAVPIDVSWLQAVQAAPALPARVAVPLQPDGVPDAAPAPWSPASMAALPAEGPLPATAPPIAWSDALLLAWALGSIAFLVALALAVQRGRRRLQELGPVPPALQHEVDAIARRLGVRTPELLDDPVAASPCVWSLGRARLVLPAAVLAASSPKGRAAVLAHELAHLRRRDHLLAHGELLLAVGLWWHPLFWLARARLRHWAELACDAWAIASVPEATIDYAAVLIAAVARPDSAVPGMTVLAARPAARAAFERRLTMILNENVPCRASRAWWLPFASLGLGMFAVPVVAQREPEVRVEVRVNGKDVGELTAAERRALLQRLLETEEGVKTAEAPKKEKQKAKQKQEPQKADKPSRRKLEAAELELGEGLPSKAELREMIEGGLAEAKAEILADEDLRELGITDEVVELLDNLGSGKGIDGSIDGIVKAAMKGAGKLVTKELAEDPDLQKLGLADGIGKLVQSFLENERNQEMLGDLARRAAKSALQDAKVEIRNDADLQKLGISVDVEGLLDSVLSGKGDFDSRLQRIIDKAVQSGMREMHEEHEHAGDEDEAKLAPRKKTERKAKKPSDSKALIR